MKFAYLLIIVLVFIAGCDISKLVCVNERCFRVEMARTSKERQIGLMNHDNLASGEGMWFVFDDDAKHSFWMKNMKFPIDIVWVDNEFNVVDVKNNASPCQDNCEIYSPSKEARYVLEVNINSGINIGDKVNLK